MQPGGSAEVLEVQVPVKRSDHLHRWFWCHSSSSKPNSIDSLGLKVRPVCCCYHGDRSRYWYQQKIRVYHRLWELHPGSLHSSRFWDLDFQMKWKLSVLVLLSPVLVLLSLVLVLLSPILVLLSPVLVVLSPGKALVVLSLSPLCVKLPDSRGLCSTVCCCFPCCFCTFSYCTFFFHPTFHECAWTQQSENKQLVMAVFGGHQ